MKCLFSKFLIGLILSLLCLACDKIDDLGGLEGQWQLIDWTDPDGNVRANMDTQIYYRFQLGLIDFHKVSPPDGFDHACFQNNGDHIRIYNPHKYVGNGHSEILSMALLSKYGVPQDGVMKIETLTSGKLVLDSPEVGRLTFRKY